MQRLVHPILRRFGDQLSVLVLGAYVAAIVAAAGVPVLTIGGAAGWAGGALAGLSLGHAGRVPCGRLIRRLVDA